MAKGIKGIKMPRMNFHATSKLGKGTANKYSSANSNYDQIKKQRKENKIKGF